MARFMMSGLFVRYATMFTQRCVSLLGTILQTPIYRSAIYILVVSLLYLPKGFAGAALPARAWICLGTMLSIGGIALYHLPQLAKARSWFSRYGLGLILVSNVLVIFSAVLYVAFAFHRFIPWVDAAKFAQSLWRILQGEGLEPVLGREFPPPTHVSPTLLLLLPLYALSPSVLTLGVIRTMLIAASSVVLYAVARISLKKDIAALLALAYLFNFPIIFQMTVEGFCETQLFPLLFLLACWYFERQRYVGWLVTLFLIGGIREEMGAVLLGFAVFAFLRGRHWRYWLGAGLLGICWLAFSYGFILGVWKGKYLFYYVFATDTTKSGFSRIFNWQNLVLLYHLGLPFVFILPFLGWSSLPVAPILIGCLYAQYSIAKAPFLHYNLPIVVGFSYATVRHLSLMGSRMVQKHGDALVVTLALMMLTLSVTRTIEHVPYEFSLHLPIGGTLGLPINQDSRILQDSEAFKRWITSLQEASKQVPRGSQASVPPHVVAHVCYQHKPLDYQYMDLESLPDYVLLDDNLTWNPERMERQHKWKHGLGQRYRVVYNENGVALFRRYGSERSQ